MAKRAGYVYAIVNPRFKGWVKFGYAANPDVRLAVYNTGDPKRRYRYLILTRVRSKAAAETRCQEAADELA